MESSADVSKREAEGTVAGAADVSMGPGGVKRKGRGFRTGAAGYLENSRGAQSREQGLDSDTLGAYPAPEGGEEEGVGWEGGQRATERGRRRGKMAGVRRGVERRKREGEGGRGRGDGGGGRRGGGGSRLLQFAFRDAVNRRPQGAHAHRHPHATVTGGEPEPLTVTHGEVPGEVVGGEGEGVR